MYRKSPLRKVCPLTNMMAGHTIRMISGRVSCSVCVLLSLHTVWYWLCGTSSRKCWGIYKSKSAFTTHRVRGIFHAIKTCWTRIRDTFFDKNKVQMPNSLFNTDYTHFEVINWNNVWCLILIQFFSIKGKSLNRLKHCSLYHAKPSEQLLHTLTSYADKILAV